MSDAPRPTAPRPPRLAVRLLERCLPPDEGEALLGDLLEAFARRAAVPDGERAARRAFWRESMVALVALRPRLPALAFRPAHQESRMAGFLGDLRHGARLLRRAPGFTAVCALTLGLAIGASVAIVSVAGPLLLRPLPYPHPERLTFVFERGADGKESHVGYATFADLARESRTIEHAAAIGDWQPTLAGEGSAAAERLAGERVSWTFFRTLGVQPALGRDFLEEEDRPDRNAVVILTHGLWARRFGGDPSVVGRTVDVDGRTMTVVGVLPADFDNVVSPDAQIFRALGYDAQPWACRTCRHLRVIARLRPGVTRDAARGELDRLSGRLVAAYPRDYPAAGVALQPLLGWMTRGVRAPLEAVIGATALVLLIALANVTNLQLARAMRREGEFAIRTALGAGRGRLAQQLLAEGLVIALLGGAVAMAVAWAALPLLVRQLPAGLPRLAAVRLDGWALGVSAALVLGTALVVGLVPARGGEALRFGALRSGTRLVRPGHHRARAGIVVGEIALALVLLVGAGLLARSLGRLLAVDVGFDASGLLTMELQATGARYREDAPVFGYQDRVLEAVRAVPGVRDAAIASQLPLRGDMDGYGVRAQDKPLANPELAPSGDRYAVSPGFLRTMRVPVLRGRDFDAADVADSAPKTAIVSAALAARLWPGEDPIGKRIQLGEVDTPWRTVIGVAGNVHHGGLDATVTQQVYVPERQWPYADNLFSLVVRAHGDAAALAPAVRRAVASVDPSQPIARVATMEQLVTSSIAQRHLALVLFVAFGAAALLLSAAGIYGVLAGSVAERTREIGVRSALGAAPADILALVVRQGLRLTAIGLALGTAGALATTRLLRALLFDVTPADPATFLAVVTTLGLVGLAAALVPAWRAVRVDPMTALRSE